MRHALVKHARSAGTHKYPRILYALSKNKTFLKKCRDAGLSRSMVADAFVSFTNELAMKTDASNLDSLKVRHVLDGISMSEYPSASIFPLFLSHATGMFPDLQNWRLLKESCNLSDPTQWYPEARSMVRSIIFHAGPTNSGKTHTALENFLAAKSGVYCCPLRLLAREVTAKCRQRSIPCTLITGEQRDYMEDSHHVACTVEMTNVNAKYEIAVIDEIQMIGDNKRGWAWTRALLGVRAKEVHVCGEPRAISIVQKMAKECGDEFNVLEYERLTNLKVKKYPVGGVENLKSGDCLICFKRRDIYANVFKLKSSGKDAAVVYGKLPPLTKRREAHKFNDSSSGCDILLATDAVGMGLNLNIKRVVFHSLEKSMKNERGRLIRKTLSTYEALQIAGRAGRFGFQECGEVTTLYQKDIKLLHGLLRNTEEDIRKAVISPTEDHYTNFSMQVQKSNLFEVLQKFRKICTVDGNLYKLYNNEESIDVARLLQNLNLTILDSLKFSYCPVNADAKLTVSLFVSFARHYAKGRKVTYDIVTDLLWFCGVTVPPLPTDSYESLALMEDMHNALGAYLWLSFQFPETFPDRKRVSALRASVEDVISHSLENIQNKQPAARKFRKHHGNVKGPKCTK